MSLNRVILIGRLTRDPELRYSPSGVPVASFTLAVDRNQSGEKEADFIPCKAFQKSAEFASNYLGKGRLCAVEGRISVRRYEKDGQQHTFTEVLCDRLQGLDRPKDGQAVPDLDGEDPFSGQ